MKQIEFKNELTFVLFTKEYDSDEIDCKIAKYNNFQNLKWFTSSKSLIHANYYQMYITI
jgi:hypothetical protein